MMFDVGVETWGERETIIKYLWEEHSRWWGSDCKGCYTEPWRVCGAQGGRLGWNRVTRGERGGNERTGSQGAGSYMLMQTLAFFWVQWEDVGCGVGEWRDLRYFRRISPTPDWRRGHRRGRVEAGRPGRRWGRDLGVLYQNSGRGGREQSSADVFRRESQVDSPVDWMCTWGGSQTCLPGHWLHLPPVRIDLDLALKEVEPTAGEAVC